jgi:hypothetical protein
VCANLRNDYTATGCICRIWSKHPYRYRCGVMAISRNAAIRSSSGGCVLNNEEKVPLPKSGFTMHSAEVEGESEVVGMRLL